MATQSEIARVTAISTDTFTVIRAQESTVARAIVAGDQIVESITAKSLTDIESALTALGDKPDVSYVSVAALPANTYNNGALGVGATLTATANGPLIIDSVTITAGQVGERVIITAEAAQANNGWYTITQVGVVAVSPYILTRAVESDQAAEIGAGYLTRVIASNTITPGTNNGKVYISIAADPFTVGTTSLTFSQVGGVYTAANGLTLSGSAFSIDTAITVDKTTAQTLTNKTLTAPVLSSPTGLVAADIPNLAASKITSGSLIVAQGGTGLASLTAHGVIIGEGTSNVAVTAAGTSTQLLQSGGASADPGWITLSGDATIAAGGAVTLKNTGPGATGPIGDTTHSASVTIDAQGRVTALSSNVIAGGSSDKLGLTPTALKTSAYTAVAGDLVTCDTATTAAFTVTLPSAPADGVVIGVIMTKQSGTRAVTVARGGTDVFNVAANSTSLLLNVLYQMVLLQYQSSTGIWYSVADYVPSPTSTSVGITDTQTLTNKKITKRIEALPNQATVTPDTDANDGGVMSNISQTTTIANPTMANVTDMQQYLLRIRNTSGSARSIGYGSKWVSTSVTLLVTIAATNPNSIDQVFQYNAATTNWECVAKVTAGG